MGERLFNWRFYTALLLFIPITVLVGLAAEHQPIWLLLIVPVNVASVYVACRIFLGHYQ